MADAHLLEEMRGICVVLDVTTTGAHVEGSSGRGGIALGPFRPRRRGPHLPPPLRRAPLVRGQEEGQGAQEGRGRDFLILTGETRDRGELRGIGIGT